MKDEKKLVEETEEEFYQTLDIAESVLDAIPELEGNKKALEGIELAIQKTRQEYEKETEEYWKNVVCDRCLTAYKDEAFTDLTTRIEKMKTNQGIFPLTLSENDVRIKTLNDVLALISWQKLKEGK